MSWIPLHVHSQYSILDSTASTLELAKRAKHFDISALALTDNANMHGAVDFYKDCNKEGIKPIIGCEFFLSPTSRLEKKKISNMPTSFSSLILLAKDIQGYKNLCRLSSIGYTEGFYYKPRIDKELLSSFHEGLVCLTGAVGSSIGHYYLKEQASLFSEEIDFFLRLFKDDFYFELQRHYMNKEDISIDQMNKESWLIHRLEEYTKQQRKLTEALIQVSKEKGVKCVATNNIHYLNREDWKGHEILLNIQSGEPCEIWERDSKGNPVLRVPNPKRKVYSSHEFYFKSPEQMQHLFADCSDAVTNTQEVADKCDFHFDFKTKHYPVFIPPHLKEKQLTSKERQQAANEYLYKLCVDAIDERYSKEVLEEVKKNYPSLEPLEVVKKRIEDEYLIISSKGMCDYLLIVYDFISWAKSQKIPVGPGRGSAAGSILAYLLGITDIEPLRFNLFFERFINPERLSYPDIDVDICMDRRSEVIDYTIRKYGKEKVAQIITFGTMKAKMAIKDVGRVLSVALSKVNSIAKLIPEDPKITIEQSLELDPELKKVYETDSEAKMVIDIAKKVEGSIRNTSTHAAGVIISAVDIKEYAPICVAKDADMLVTQYAMKPVEAVGMLKIDFLGLKTLTSIQKAVDYVAKTVNEKIEWEKLSLDNKKTFDLLNLGKTLGIFQLESGGMQDLARKLHIDLFEEIIAVGALYRPGPMDMIPSFILRKHGKEKIEFDHPLMKEILQETYGVMVYQEQVMQIASKLAGYSLGEGDVLRRAMGKKDAKEMTRQRKKFVQGAFDKGIDEELAKQIFDKIEKFASYGFNKSHATAYAYLSYTTAFLKANYPKPWMAALMTCDRYDLSKVSKFITEAKAMEIAILPPDVNEANQEFFPAKSGIRFAMSGIKGLGSAVADAIVEEREKNGVYGSLFDFITRIDKTRVGRKNIELLIDAGGFDFTGWTRDELRLSVEQMYEIAVKQQKEDAKGILNLFSVFEDENAKFTKPPKVATPYTKLEVLQREKELLGFYLTGHPMDNYQSILKKLSCIPLKEIKNLEDETVFRAAFILDDVKFKISNRNQKKFAILTISDGSYKFEVPIWSDLYEEKAHLLIENMLIYAVLVLDKKEGSIRLQCKWLDDLTNANQQMIKICDDVYDQAKIQLKMNNNRKRNARITQEKEVRIVKNIILKANADKIKLSNILQVKDILKNNPGKTKVEIQFYSNLTKVGSILVDASFGVQLSEDVKKKFEKITAIEDIAEIS